ncbi:glycosyltransferase [Mastigocoleus sp. MO_188.B34]|uniref:glycosyltransferase family protein n=1 Tax=Mastigocoleus sp. MO_188.B34 TaxID=3036635 RepID=UPI00263318CF|nr:glycosyltransferase [Mastigocoleus sp. MO_188.B34]MDJ0693530.1 glycosyltransferase [Mastigocoleus sp. MO_188.B34]
MRLMVYSHDTFGLGNIRRMLAICNYLLDSIPDISIILVSGSPAIHSFRLHPRLDYIKLPCIGRDREGKLSAKYLRTSTEKTIRLRSELIKTTAVHFQPDLLLVDKKPYGLQSELKETLTYLNTHKPETKLVLLLRDILDRSEVTISEWEKNQYYQAIEWFYDKILVVGMPEVFDLVKEYNFSTTIVKKVNFCGYIRRELGLKSGSTIRQELQIKPSEKLVLVTPGGGEDGYRLIDTYLQSFIYQTSEVSIKSLIVSGPEMPSSQREALSQVAQNNPNFKICEFTDDIISYMEAADTIVSMAGYNTVCEILSLSKRAVVVPRTQPVQEQLIRAQRMSSFGLFRFIHPDNLTPENLLETVMEQLNSTSKHFSPVSRLDLDALPRIEQELSQLCFGKMAWELSPMEHNEEDLQDLILGSVK